MRSVIVRLASMKLAELKFEVKTIASSTSGRPDKSEGVFLSVKEIKKYIQNLKSSHNVTYTNGFYYSDHNGANEFDIDLVILGEPTHIQVQIMLPEKFTRQMAERLFMPKY